MLRDVDALPQQRAHHAVVDQFNLRWLAFSGMAAAERVQQPRKEPRQLSGTTLPILLAGCKKFAY